MSETLAIRAVLGRRRGGSLGIGANMGRFAPAVSWREWRLAASYTSGTWPLMAMWPYLALFASGLCWGLGLPFGKLALAEADAAHMILLRFVVAALAAAPLLLRTSAGRRLLFKPKVIMSGGFYALGFLTQFEGLARSSVTIAALLVGVMPALVAASAAVLGEKIGPKAWAGVVAATLGAVLIAGRPAGQASPLGVGFCLLSLPMFLGWLYASRTIETAEHPVEAACASIIVAAVVLLALVVGLHGAPSLALSGRAWGGILGQGLFSTLAATLCWQLGSPRVSTAAAGVFINVEPVVGAVVGVLLFGDHPTWLILLGGALILAGSLVVVLQEERRPGGVKAAQDAPTPA